MTHLTAPQYPQGRVSPRIITAADAGRQLADLEPSGRLLYWSCQIGFLSDEDAKALASEFTANHLRSLPKDEAKALIDEITGKEMG